MSPERNETVPLPTSVTTRADFDALIKQVYETPTLLFPDTEIVTLQDAARGLASGKYVFVGPYLCEIVRG